jgi:hypothetical protein
MPQHSSGCPAPCSLTPGCLPPPASSSPPPGRLPPWFLPAYDLLHLELDQLRHRACRQEDQPHLRPGISIIIMIVNCHWANCWSHSDAWSIVFIQFRASYWTSTVVLSNARVSSSQHYKCSKINYIFKQYTW